MNIIHRNPLKPILKRGASNIECDNNIAKKVPRRLSYIGPMDNHQEHKLAEMFARHKYPETIREEVTNHTQSSHGH